MNKGLVFSRCLWRRPDAGAEVSGQARPLAGPERLGGGLAGPASRASAAVRRREE
jgi:hypothetical protein